jgi:hypothetical protein
MDELRHRSNSQSFLASRQGSIGFDIARFVPVSCPFAFGIFIDGIDLRDNTPALAAS